MNFGKVIASLNAAQRELEQLRDNTEDEDEQELCQQAYDDLDNVIDNLQ